MAEIWMQIQILLCLSRHYSYSTHPEYYYPKFKLYIYIKCYVHPAHLSIKITIPLLSHNKLKWKPYATKRMNMDLDARTIFVIFKLKNANINPHIDFYTCYIPFGKIPFIHGNDIYRYVFIMYIIYYTYGHIHKIYYIFKTKRNKLHAAHSHSHTKCIYEKICEL